MAITQAVPDSLKVELGQGIHSWTTDQMTMALYLDSANLGASTTAYTATGEVANGNGYTTGGMDLTVANSGTLDNGVAVFSWEEPSWSNSTFTCRGCLVYNKSKSNRAMGVYDFGVNVTGQGGAFIVRMPPATWNQAVFRIAG